ncbi:hypothetical protein IB254_04410 [Pseudomonas sp. PDM03]|uniref:hypothetical protein n=1 Tax=Pseudomonas sp. PDM03 TaxID=2769266 RepID=UPI00177B3080|nr:hypothetical protein [Pseudomonas sp. PDM03]MBD9586297.1 hypothetical protein [Pseudomonas sp. PDM03]
MTINLQAGFTLPIFWDEARLFINGQEYRQGEAFFLLRGQPNQVTIEVSSDIAQQVRVELAEDNDLNPVASPVFGEWVHPVDGKFSWTITPDDGDSGHLTLVFISREVNLPWELSCRVMATDLSDEVDSVRVDGVAYPDDVVLFRDEPRTITLIYKPGSPVQDWPLELKATLLSGLKEGDLVVTLVGPHRWTITASNNSGTFKLDLTGTGFTSGISVPVSKVLSRNLADEARVQIDGQDAESGMVYFRGGVHTLTLVPTAGSPIAGYMIGLWLGRSPLVTCDPPAETFTGVHSWKITLATDRSGLFHFEFAAEHFGRGNIKIDANKLLSRDLADEVTSFLLDDVAIPPTGADFDGWKINTLSLDYKNAGLLNGVPIALKWDSGSGVVQNDLDCTPSFSQLSTSHNWKIKSAKHGSGTFRLKISTAVDSNDGAMLTPVNRLLAPDFTGTTLKFQAGSQPAPVPPQTTFVNIGLPISIVVRLQFPGGAPVVGMPATIVVPDKGTYSGKTGSPNGFFSTPYMTFFTAGVKTVTAEATLPGGTRLTATVLLEVGKGAEE